MILVGKDISTDGSMLLAHNNDLPGDNASVVEKIPRLKHNAEDVIEFPSSLKIPQVSETYEWMAQRVCRGFVEGDAVAVNEFQVAIAGGVALGKDRNEKASKAFPMVKEGLTGGVRYIALERTKTARECIELLGELYSKYGITYPSGVGIADPNEIWYIEAGGGYQWAAVKVPNNAVWVQANGFRIGEINWNDKDNFLYSPNLKEEVVKKGLWSPKDGPFNFSKVFGRGKKQSSEHSVKYYDSRRVWRAMTLLDPSLNLDPDAMEFPMFISPKEKVSLSKLTSILRDHYQQTQYNVFPKGGKAPMERAIAVTGCVHTDIIQLRSWLPADIGAVLWAAPGPSLTAVYIPFYFGVNSIPEAYRIAQMQYNYKSVYWVYRSLMTLVAPYYNELVDDIRLVWDKFEAREFALQNPVEGTAIKLYQKDKKLAKDFLNCIL